MENDKPKSDEAQWKGRVMCRGKGDGGGVSSGVYGLAFLGALIYFIQQANTFGEGVIGFLKACIWPALVVYKLLGFLAL